MCNRQRREPDGADVGLVLYALMFLIPIVLFIASVIVAPFVFLFGVERESSLHFWLVGIVAFLLVAGYLGYKSE